MFIFTITTLIKLSALLAICLALSFVWLGKKYGKRESNASIIKIWHLVLGQMLILPALAFAYVQNKISISNASTEQFEFIAAAVLGYIILFLLCKCICYIVPAIVAKIRHSSISPAILGVNILILGLAMNIAAWLIIRSVACI